MAQSFFSSFDAEFQPDIDKVEEKGRDVKRVIRLAVDQAAAQDQALEAEERKENAKSRSILKRVPKIHNGIQSMQLDKARRDKGTHPFRSMTQGRS